MVVAADLDLYAQDVAVRDGLAYVADGLTGLRVIDLSHGELRQIGSLALGGAASIALADDLALVGDRLQGVWIVDVSDPTAPVALSSLGDITATDIHVSGTLAYVGARGEGLLIVDLSFPTNPTVVGRLPTQGGRYPLAIDVSGGIAYLAEGYGGLRIVDVSDPGAPAVLAALDLGDTHSAVLVRGATAYVSAGRKLWVLDVSVPSAPVIVSSRSLDLYGNDAAGGEDLVYLAHLGLIAIDASDPSGPVALGSLATPLPTLGIAISEGLAYLADNRRFRAVDLSHPEFPTQVAQLPQSPTAVADGTAYLVKGGRLIVYDVADPANPILLSNQNVGLFERIAVAGPLAYLLSSTRGLEVWGVSDPTAPHLLGSVALPRRPRDLVVQGGTAFVLDSSEGLIAVDVSNPEAPVVSGSLDVFENPWGISVVGDFAYVADHYSGLRVVDVSSPAAPRLVSTLALYGARTGVAAVEGYAFVIGLQGAMTTVDVRDPLAPREIPGSAVLGTREALDIEIEGELAYVSGQGPVQVIDISDPAAPVYRSGFGRFSEDAEVSRGIVYSSGRVIDFGPELTPPRTVALDIEPRRDPNRIGLDHGAIRVAVLGSADFDVLEIDPESLAFGPEGAPPLGDGGVAIDVNRDGFEDWVSLHRTTQTGIALGDEEACIEGRYRDGRRFRGCDDVVVTMACGIGFEIALPLIAVSWMRSRRDRNRRYRKRGITFSPS